MSQTKMITRMRAVELILASSKAFGVTFIKRKTQEERTGQFQLNRDIAGSTYNPYEKGLIPVIRVLNDQSEGKGKYRSIPVEGITHLSINGEQFEVKPDA